MPTIVDSVVVQLSLDPSGFKKGQEEATRGFAKVKDQATKSGKEMEAANKALGEQFSKLKGEALGFFAVLLGARGIKDFVASINTANAQLGRFGANIGASPQLVYGWEKAVERMGGTSDEAASSLDSIANALWQVHNMGQPLPQELYRLQSGMGEIAATHFDTEHGVVPFMNDVAAQAQRLAAIDPQSAFRLLTGAGISEATANTMIRYGAGMGAYADSIARAVAPSKEAIEDAQHLQDAWGRVRSTVDGIGNDAIPALDRALTPLLDKMASFLQRFRDAEKSPEGHSVPIPWGDFWNKTKNFFDMGAHGAELPAGGASPDFDEGAFESRRGAARSGLQVEGHDISRGNPLPVDIVRASVSSAGDAGNGLLGGPIGTGTPLPPSVAQPIPPHAGGGAPPLLRSRGTPAQPPGVAGTYRPVYSLGGSDLSDAVVNTIAGEAHTNNQAGVDAVIDNMLNRVGSTGYGPSGNLEQVARAPGQYTGYRVASAAEAALIRARIRAIASGGVPDTTGGSNEYRASWYHGPWGWKHPEGKNVGGNVFARNPRVKLGPYAPYDKPHGKNAPAWWSGVPLAANGAPSGGARLSSMAASKPVTTSSTSNNLHIAKIDVNAPNATDANGIAAELTASLERSTMAMLAQSGQA